jgi:ATP-binding cassette subfamily B protein
VYFFGRVRGSFRKMDDAEGAMTATLQENLTGIRVVRAFARQEFECDRFSEKNVAHRDLNDRLYRVMAWYWSSSDLLAFTQNALVLFVGAWRVHSGEMTLGTLVAFISYMQLYLWPVREMGRVLTELGKATVAIGRIQEILDVPREADAPLPSIDLPARVSGDIRIANVSLSYGDAKVLDDVTLHVAAGQTLAIVGPSGSGKSTLIQLLLRLLDYQAGRIELDDMEIRELPRKYVRRQFGVVMQEPFLYSKTLRENIGLGRHEASEDEVMEGARIACIHESIEGFDKRYDTIVGERGVTLSGGQRQRVAIASAVDTHTETLILDALKRRRGQHTTIVIAHRLSTLMHADQIAVLEGGRVTQLGTHEQLAEQDGLYKQLWQIQTALEEDLSRELGTASGTPTELISQR